MFGNASEACVVFAHRRRGIYLRDTPLSDVSLRRSQRLPKADRNIQVPYGAASGSQSKSKEPHSELKPCKCDRSASTQRSDAR